MFNGRQTIPQYCAQTLRRLTSGRRPARAALILAIVCVVAMLDGCYYMQAAKGQYDVMRKRQPLDEIIEDESVDERLRQRLQMVVEARQFAVEELQLPDNDSYMSYADLQRDYVVWNVFAAPEFSLTPLTWCYPVAGCVAYRGYFKEASARKKAAALEADGYDVSVGGVAAYSTLGRFSDPVLNTMMRWSDADLVATLFHELAHQQLYVKDDTEFNESFATAVADIGLRKWFGARNDAGPDEPELGAYHDRRALRRQLVDLTLAAKEELGKLYASDQSEEDKRVVKSNILDKLSRDAEALVTRAGAGSTNWLRPPLNNARLASIGLYENHVPAFLTLYADCRLDLSCFYESAEELSGLDIELRKSRLEALHQSAGDSVSLRDAARAIGTDP